MARVTARQRPTKTARRWVRYHSARCALAGLARVPRGPALATFGALGRLAHRMMPKQRRLVTGQIDRVYATRSSAWRRRLVRQAFIEIAVSAVDVARLARGRRDELLRNVDLPSEERLSPLLGGRGAIAIGGHYGAWELLPPLLAALGARVTTLVRPIREARLDRLVARLRMAHGVDVMTQHVDARRLIRLLREGGTLAIAADQTPRGRRVRGELLGLPVELPAGPAALASAARVPLVPVAIRRAGARHVFLVGEPIEPPTERGGSPTIEEMTGRYAGVMGEWIGEAPEQWAWFHERWKDEAYEGSKVAEGARRAPGGAPAHVVRNGA